MSESSRDQQVQAILHSYLQAVDAGQTPDREEILRQHPAFAAELREFFADQAKMDCLAQSLHRGHALASEITLGADDPHSAAVPQKLKYFGDYELEEEIARGAMGVVFKARQVSLNRPVALKMILKGELATEADVQRFRDEAEAAANLDHPNIVPIYEIGAHEGQQYFSMKLIGPGQRRTELGVKETVRITALVARAVHHAHQRGILHRDLKPSNILFDENGDPHVADFGLAKRVGNDSGRTRSGAIVGTPSYMAPEQARAEKVLTTAVDVYSLGAILYEWLTGQPPFRGNDVLATLAMVANDEPTRPRTLNPRIDRDLETICLKCLNKDPARRYGSAEMLAEDLERWQRGEPILARPVGWAGQLWRWTRRNRGAAAAIAVVALALVTATVVSTVARQAERQALRRADGLRLSALSEAVRAKKPDLALLLAIEGAERHPGELADNALWAALDVSYQKRTLQASKQGVFAAFFTNDGREILTLCDDRITRRWDAASYELLGEIKGPPLRGSIPKNQGGWKEVEGIGEYPVAAAYTSAGLRVLTGAEKGFMVRDEKNQVVCEIRHEAKGAHGIMGRNPDGQVSPDGTKVVIVFGQRQPPEESVFDAQTGEKLFAISGHRDYIQFAVFSPDSSRLVSCSRDTTARVWDTKTGRLVATFTGHTAEVGAVAFSPDGKRAASWSRQQQDGEVVARIWEVESGREVSRLEVPKNEGACVAQVFFSPDGKTVVTCNQHGGGGFNPESLSVLCIWDAATGKRLHTLLPRRLDDYDYRSKASVAALSRDGRLLAAGSENGVVRLFDAAKGELLRELLGHEGELSDIQFHADGRTLLTAATDGSVRLWDIVGPEDELYHGVWRRIHGLTASPDGRRLLLSRTTQEKVALLVNRDEGRTHTLAGHRWGIDVRGFSGDGAKALTASSNAVFIWEASTGKLLRELRPDGDGRRIDAAALSADGKVAFSQARGGPAQLWDVTTGKALRSLQEPIVEVAGIQTGLFTADSARLLTTRGRLVPPLVGDAMRVTLWDVATGRRLHEFEDDRENKTGEFGTIDGGTSFGIISPDGARVLTCSSNGTARIWDAVSGERGPRLIGHTGGVTWGAFSPDGRLAATASQDGTARLWDVATGKELRVFRGHETGLERGRKTGLICVHFSPNGTRLLTAASDGKARVVAVATGKLIRHFPLLPGRERFAAFLDDDTIVSLASEIVRIWAVDALAEAKRRKPRELTPAEREKYEVDGVAR